GSPGAASARQWFADQVARLGLRVRREPFSAIIPGRGRVRLENLVVTIPGRSPEALAVLAHLDNVGTGPGANDNASGIAALIELARSYATSVSGNAPPGASIVSPAHTLFFVATDGGEFGGVGAVTVTTADDRRPPPFSDTPQRLNGGRLAQIGRSAQELLRALDQGAELVQGTSSYVYLGARVIRGWAIQLVLIAALLPFLIA